MEHPMIEKARDEAANQWVDSNVPQRLIEELRRWARSMIDAHDEDDCATIGVLLLDVQSMHTSYGRVLRGYTYSLIFNWDDGRKGTAARALLRVSDSNEVVEFIPVDEA
jgi:hypothetical protein